MALKIAFTSCMNAERCPEQPLWREIARAEPDVLLLLGDVIYMDWGLASLAKVPGAKRVWADASAEQKQEVLKAFEQEMHARYAMQWGVDDFRALVKAQRQRALVLTWDDHDFAWNNALGSGSGKEALDDKVVPEPFKTIALLQRQRFEWVLRTWGQDSYPGPGEFPVMNGASPAEPVFDSQWEGATLLVLDQRWSRTHRDAPRATLLSPAARVRLDQEVANADGGLLIVAGSSPLKHRSLSGGHSSWWAEPDLEKAGTYDDRAYPEYEILLQAKRPVLYLGGEIHRNAWGGWVELPPRNGTRVPVVQALSSGAALGRLLFHRFRPSFGMVQVTTTPAGASVRVDLHQLEPASVDSRTLEISGGQWNAATVPEGECTDSRLVTDAGDRMLSLVDGAALNVFSIRRLGSAFKKDTEAELKPEELDAEGLTDELPKTITHGDIGGTDPWPTALRAQGVGGRIRLQCLNHRDGVDDPSRAQRLVEETFAVARAAGRSVLLFVHGFGKGAAAAMSQALELRERFQCEVLLYTWPTASGSGLFSAIAGFKQAQRSAQLSSPALGAVLGTFCNVASSNADIPAAVLARSLGAEALAEVGVNALGNMQTEALRRLVFSAPACSTRGHAKWLAAVKCPVVITVNREDRTLRLADVVLLGVKLLGRDEVDPQDPSWAYLDCTDVSGVGSAKAHDYLFRDCERRLTALNQQLLTGQAVDFAAHRVPGMVAHWRGKTYR